MKNPIIEEIDARIARIKSDERFNYPTAYVDVNAPLALIQCGLESRVAELESLRASIQNKAAISNSDTAELTKTLKTIADQAHRAALVQDRSVGIIKMALHTIAADARNALARYEKTNVIRKE